jgi:hypothetical protein
MKSSLCITIYYSIFFKFHRCTPQVFIEVFKSICINGYFFFRFLPTKILSLKSQQKRISYLRYLDVLRCNKSIHGPNKRSNDRTSNDANLTL